MKNYHPIVMGALEVAQSRVLNDKHLELTAWHLLWGLIQNPQSYASRGLREYKKKVEEKLKNLPTAGQAVPMDQIKTSGDLSKWMTLASGHAVQNGKSELTESDLLRFIHQVLPELDFDPKKLSEITNSDEESEVPSFLINLNQLAREGKLDPVIGRDKEIRAVMEILGRRNKNNPILVGPAGVGKTAIAEGLALAVHTNEVPDLLKDKSIYTLDLGQLMAGTKFRGEFEERIQALLNYVKNQAGQVVLFIDEIHQLVGAGKTEGAMDAANLLKPALARGELPCIGATTDEEYQKYILGDSALDRRFRAVPVQEPALEDAVEILMGIRDKLEIHHGIKISDEAVWSSVYLSDQYITDKFLPDKAIDLVDEAASALKLSAEALPSELEQLRAEIRSKKINVRIKKGAEKSDLEREITQLEKSFEAQKQIWDKEVLKLKEVSELKNKADRWRFDLEEAKRRQNYEEASRIQYSLLPEVENRLKEVAHSWVLGKSHVAQVISRQTGIPVEKILKDKQENILQLNDYLKSQVFGQESALSEISETLVASHAGLTDESRPLGSFLLLGPSGVGKTQTAKSLTKFLFEREKNLIRLDMSEFSEKHSVAKLIGAPAGYVGYDDGGVLTEAVRKHPYSVLLFDEIEKAHPDFADILLQILDDGRLTDSKGRTVNFKNTVVFLTTNARDIERTFKPEVLGRLDAILNYSPIDKSIMHKLVARQVDLLNERLSAKEVKISLTSAMIDELANRGHHADYGARPLQHIFSKLITRPLSHQLLKGELGAGELEVSWDGLKAQYIPV